ncbi:MAG: hypothetical protein ABFS28_09045 [Bacteroidota bacterium]
MEALVQSTTRLQEELDASKSYLENSASGFKGKLSWTCSVEDDIDTGLIIPKKLIRTFVENAISGGLIQDKEGGSVEISSHNTSLGMLIMINDQGIYFKDISSTRQQKERRLRSLDKYLNLFNARHPYLIRYDIHDRSIHDADKSGSRILITIQY